MQQCVQQFAELDQHMTWALIMAELPEIGFLCFLLEVQPH